MSVERPVEARLATSRLRLLAAFCALSLVLHLPGMVVRLFNSDEASIATVAMVVNDGGTLYRDAADRKPPAVPYLYAAMARLTGTRDLRPVRALGAIVLAVTALLLAGEAQRRYRSRRAGLWCGVLFLLATVTFFPPDTQAAGFELFMLAPMTGAVVAAARGRPVWAGVLLGVACLTKQTAITTALPIAWLLVRDGGWRRAAQAGAATVVVVAAAALPLGPERFLLWNFTGNGGYLTLRGSFGATIGRAAAMTGSYVGIHFALMCLAIWAGYKRRPAVDTWLWLGAAAVGVVIGFRFFGHYYLQLLPPLVLVGVSVVDEIPAAARNLAMGFTAFAAAFFVVFSFTPPGQNGVLPYGDVADAVKASTSADDRILVWGKYPEIYWASGREPATRFVHTGFLIGNLERNTDVGLPGADRLLVEDFDEHRPVLVLDTTGARIRDSAYYPLSATPLWPAIQREYRPVGTVDGVVFYRRVGT